MWGDEHNSTCGDATTVADSDSCSVAVVRYGQTANFGYVPNRLLPNTFTAVTVDLGDPSSPFGDIHPRDKQQMSSRLARSALAVAYRDPLTPYNTTTGDPQLMHMTLFLRSECIHKMHKHDPQSIPRVFPGH